MQYSKQAHKIFATSDENFLLFFNNVKKKSKFKIFLWENEHGSPLILIQIIIPNSILHNIYFL